MGENIVWMVSVRWFVSVGMALSYQVLYCILQNIWLFPARLQLCHSAKFVQNKYPSQDALGNM